MNGLLTDVRFSVRELARKPGFTAATILTLALGIGANTAVFSVLNGYLLKPLAYPQANQLVLINESFPGTHQPYVGVSIQNYLDIKQKTPALANAALYKRDDVNLTNDGRTQLANLVITRSSLFEVLRAKPHLGRVFTAENEQEGRNHVAVLSYTFWQQAFGRDPNVIGSSVKLNGKPYRIIGVMQQGWHFPDRRVDVLIPFVFQEFWLHHCRGCSIPQTTMIARLKPGIGLNAMRAQLAQLQLRLLRKMRPRTRNALQKEGWNVRGRRYKDVLVGNRKPLVLILQGFVLLVLVMACVNVANLLLARILGRSHEIAMRATLGASRSLLARQLFVESLCLAIPGGLVGVAIGWLGVSFIQKVGLGARLGLFSLTPDWRVGLFALIVMILVAAAISILPIRQLSRNDLQSLLQEGGRAVAGSRRAKRLRGALVVAEIALAAGLLGGTGLLVNSFIRLQSVQPGFKTAHVLTADMLLPSTMNDSAGERYYDQLLQRVRALPGVASAGVVGNVPIKAAPTSNSYRLPGVSPPATANPTQLSANRTEASAGYFKAMGITLLRGRLFGPQDTANSQPSVIIDEKLAGEWFPHESPIGHRMTVGGYNGPEGDPIPLIIVGEVDTIHAASLNQAPQQGAFYLNALQIPPMSELSGRLLRSMSLVVKTTVPPYSLSKPIKQLVNDINPLVSISNFTSMRDVLGRSLRERVAVMVLVLVFACIGLALAAVGVYGVMSYVVGQRVTECGVRLALGALPGDLLWLIIRDGLRLLAAGLCIGLLLSVVLGYAISSQLFNVVPFDPLTLMGVFIVLSIITLGACWLPARRVARLDPAVALQE